MSIDDDGISVTVRYPVELGTAYNAVVQLADDTQADRLALEINLASAMGSVIRERRQAAGMGLRRFSKAAGLGQSLVCKIERGTEKRGGTVLTLMTIARTLGMQSSELLALVEARVAAAGKKAA